MTKANFLENSQLELRIQIDVDTSGSYKFRVSSGSRVITTTTAPDLAASFFEDLRLLRWKSAGIHDPGDILLNHVGDRLATLIAPPDMWKKLRLSDTARHVRVQFSRGAHGLMQFPWELLRVDDRFLIGARGSHLVREVRANSGPARARNPVTGGSPVTSMIGNSQGKSPFSLDCYLSWMSPGFHCRSSIAGDKVPVPSAAKL
jgi:hypothetical protein